MGKQSGTATMLATAALVVGAAFWWTRRARAAQPAAMPPGSEMWSMTAPGSPDRIQGAPPVSTPVIGGNPAYVTNQGDILTADLIAPDGRGGFNPLP